MNQSEDSQRLSAENHIITINSYGSHRVKNAHTGQMVSAQKIGY